MLMVMIKMKMTKAVKHIPCIRHALRDFPGLAPSYEGGTVLTAILQKLWLIGTQWTYI